MYSSIFCFYYWQNIISNLQSAIILVFFCCCQKIKKKYMYTDIKGGGCVGCSKILGPREDILHPTKNSDVYRCSDFGNWFESRIFQHHMKIFLSLISWKDLKKKKSTYMVGGCWNFSSQIKKRPQILMLVYFVNFFCV